MLLYSLLSRMNALLKHGLEAFHRAGWFYVVTQAVSVSEREGPLACELCYCKHLGEDGNIIPAVKLHCESLPSYLDSASGFGERGARRQQ